MGQHLLILDDLTIGEALFLRSIEEKRGNLVDIEIHHGICSIVIHPSDRILAKGCRMGSKREQKIGSQVTDTRVVEMKG